MLLSFSRMPNGDVEVLNERMAMHWRIPAAEWSAIVASVSPYADQTAAVEFARLLHTGDLENVPPFRKRVDSEP
jgi:hypothetical protein